MEQDARKSQKALSREKDKLALEADEKNAQEINHDNGAIARLVQNWKINHKLEPLEKEEKE